METMQDWLLCYNNLNKVPGVEALTKMKEFYMQQDINIFKDTVSISGVSMQSVLQGAFARGAKLLKWCMIL